MCRPLTWGLCSTEPSGLKYSHGGKGGHGHGHHEDKAVFGKFWQEIGTHPNILFGEIAVVVLLSILFETWEHWVRHRMTASGDRTGGKILDALFKEFTGLGFIGLLLYLLTQSGIADILAAKVFHQTMAQVELENPLKETFETVHMMIFMLLVVLLLQAAFMLIIAHRMANRWGCFERTRTFGSPSSSLESMLVKAGYLQRVPDPSAPRGLRLEPKKEFTYDCPFVQRLLGKNLLQKLVMWRALRHEFLFPADGHSFVQNPVHFSFESYLRSRLGSTVLSLVEVDKMTWFLTMLVLLPLIYYCTTASLVTVEALQCGLGWLLLAGALGLAWCLEEDLLRLTPRVPTDPRHLLRLFVGTSSRTLRRQLTMGCVGDKDVASQEIKLGAPGLGGVELEERQKLVSPQAFELEWTPKHCSPGFSRMRTKLSSSGYAQCFELLAFWQALCVTSLIISFLSQPLSGWIDIGLYCLAWAEWPIMFYFVVPVLLQRLTLRNSIGAETDDALIRAVCLETKESFLRLHVRLVQLMGFERRAANHGVAWTLNQASLKGRQFHPWTKGHALRLWKGGRSRFDKLPASEKQALDEIFESWDLNNDEAVSAAEMAESFEHMGFAEHALEAAANLVRCVDYDCTGTMSRSKFQAVAALATASRPDYELLEDLETFFALIDGDQAEKITVLKLSEWLQKTKSGLNEDDVASLVCRYFGQAKALVTREEFVEWIEAVGTRSTAFPGEGHSHHTHHGHHGHHGHHDSPVRH